MTGGFRHEVSALGDRGLVVKVVGRLSDESWPLYERSLDRHMALGGRARLIFDCRELGGFQPAIARKHGAWLTKHAGSVERVAVVSEVALVRFGVASARLVTSVNMQVFTTLEDATAWSLADD